MCVILPNTVCQPKELTTKNYLSENPHTGIMDMEEIAIHVSSVSWLWRTVLCENPDIAILGTQEDDRVWKVKSMGASPLKNPGTSPKHATAQRQNHPFNSTGQFATNFTIS